MATHRFGTLKYRTVSLFALLLATAPSLLTTSSLARAEMGDISTAERDSRLAHAHELLGKYYKHSVVVSGEKIQKVNGMIYRWTRESLPKAYRDQYQAIAQAIIDESLRNDFDPVFVASVIVNESSFDPRKIGSVGEIGLMQLRPKTAQWIARYRKLEGLEKLSSLRGDGKDSLRNPLTNIKLGTAYLSYLRERFDSHARLYLAAYNMGQGNVQDALEHKIWPKDYARRVMKYYINYYRQIPKLTRVPTEARPSSIEND